MNCINKLRENVLVRNLNFCPAGGRGLIIALFLRTNSDRWNEAIDPSSDF